MGRQIIMQILKRNVLKWKPLTETINATHTHTIVFMCVFVVAIIRFVFDGIGF